VNWFYWLAGLSLITSAIALAGGGWSFVFSLGITQVIDGIAKGLSTELGEATKVIALVLDIFIIALFAFFGVFAGKKMLWIYMAGTIAILLDGLLTLLFQDLLGVLAHGFVLYFLIKGYMAGRELVAFEREVAAAAQQPPPPPTIPVESQATVS
jgi:hypothetical protein